MAKSQGLDQCLNNLVMRDFGRRFQWLVRWGPGKARSGIAPERCCSLLPGDIRLFSSIRIHAIGEAGEWDGSESCTLRHAKAPRVKTLTDLQGSREAPRD